MIIEQHLPAPTGYLAARVILFRGQFEDEDEGDDPPKIQTEPTWDEFKAVIAGIKGKFISADIARFSLKRKSAFLYRAAKRGIVRKTGEKRYIGKLKPYDVYEVCK